MASKLSAGRSSLSKSVVMTLTRPPNFANFFRQSSACTAELVTHTILTLWREAKSWAVAPAPHPSSRMRMPLLRLQQAIFHLVVVAEGRAREHARAVVHVDVAVGAEHVVISSLFVVRRLGIVLSEDTDEDGAAIFQQACKIDLEGIVSKRLSAPYRSGPSRDWIKVKNPDSPAMIRAREVEW
jgi:hypothetical protein